MAAIQQVLAALKAAATSSGSPPTSLGGLKLWADMTDNTTLYASSGGSTVSTDGNTVGLVASKGGTGTGLLQVVSGARPTYKTGVVNGKSVLRFDGTDDYFEAINQTGGATTGYITLANLITAANGVVIAACSIASADAAQANVYENDAVFSETGGYFGMNVSDPTGANVTLHSYNFDAGGVDTGSISVPRSTFAVISMRHSGGNLSIRKDGGSWTTVASANTGDLSGGPRVGCNYTVSRFLPFDLVHLAVSSSAESDASIYAVEQWMASQMGYSI